MLMSDVGTSSHDDPPYRNCNAPIAGEAPRHRKGRLGSRRHGRGLAYLRFRLDDLGHRGKARLGRRGRQVVSRWILDARDCVLFVGPYDMEPLNHYHHQRRHNIHPSYSGEARQIPELLAEQVEAADTIILNKIDLSEGEQLATAKLVVQGLNEKAELIETKFGEMTPDKIIGGIATILEEEVEVGDDHSHSHDHSCSDPDCADESHDHSHSHDHKSEETCTDPNCSDTSHSHSHSHSAEAEACSDPECSDSSHSHSHSHSSEACSDPDCNDTSHSHSHSHSPEGGCADPDCSDTSHSHSHDHKATSADNLGISSFVYKSSRPFEPRKLQRLLMTWPIPVMEELNLAKFSTQSDDGTEDEDSKSPFVGVLRSKGFTWVAPSTLRGAFNDLERHDVAMYWSHAGKHFGLRGAGTWWASIGKEAMKNVFEGNMEEYERIIKEDFVSDEWGDRRQEIVFIGANLDEEGIRDALDSCLCTDEEIQDYKQAILDAIAEYYEMEKA